MNKMDDKHRYQHCYRKRNNHDRRCDVHFKQSYEQHHQYSSSSSSDHRLNTRESIDFSNQQTTTCSYLSPDHSQPLMSTATTRPSSLLTVIPQERESWIRSVKKTKTNESTEQKTQYLETMLRMPQQQKSSISSARFDRIRFANNQTSFSTNPIDNNSYNLDDGSLHLINDRNDHDDICVIEKILFDNELQSSTIDQCSNQISIPPAITGHQSNAPTNTDFLPCSGFLIDNCDEEEPLRFSPPLHLSHPRLSTTENFLQPNREESNEQRINLTNELDTAASQRRRELKRHKRSHKRCRRGKKCSTHSNTHSNKEPILTSERISTVTNHESQELLSDWIIEYDLAESDSISQLTDMAKKTLTTDENRTAKINVILNMIRKQQLQLRKLRKHIFSTLGKEQKRDLINSTQPNSRSSEDLLTAFLNQPSLSGCWLCSGKTFTEVTTQCNIIDE